MEIDITVLLRDRVTGEDAPVVGVLRSAGVSVDRVLPQISLVTGTIHPSNLLALRALPEVKAVEKNGVFRVDPRGG